MTQTATNAHVFPFQAKDAEPAQLQCPRCGVSTEAKCSCGIDYINMRPGKRAEEAVAANPEKSDRAIAADTGLSKDTVGRARRKSGGSNATPERVGQDGKKYPSGPRIPVREGETVESLCRRGLDLEADLSLNDVAQKLGIGKQSYREARTILLLSDRNDLNASESAVVRAALDQINELRRTGPAYATVSGLANRIWGKHRTKTDKSAKRQIEQFETIVGIVIQSCVSSAHINVPRLEKERRNALLEELHDAHQAIRKLITRIQNSARE